MQLKTRVKVAEVNNLSDARYCAGMGVDFMGFVMKHPTKTILAKENFLAITGWLEGVEFVGEFWGATDEEILFLQKECAFSYVQSDSLEQCKRLFTKGLKVMYYSTSEEFNSYDFISYLVLEKADELDLEMLSKSVKYNNVLVGGEVTVKNLEVLLNEIGVSGIQLKGGEEIRPGYKDFDELADILEELELN